MISGFLFLTACTGRKESPTAEPKKTADNNATTKTEDPNGSVNPPKPSPTPSPSPSPTPSPSPSPNPMDSCLTNPQSCEPHGDALERQLGSINLFIKLFNQALSMVSDSSLRNEVITPLALKQKYFESVETKTPLFLDGELRGHLTSLQVIFNKPILVKKLKELAESNDVELRKKSKNFGLMAENILKTAKEITGNSQTPPPGVNQSLLPLVDEGIKLCEEVYQHLPIEESAQKLAPVIEPLKRAKVFLRINDPDKAKLELKDFPKAMDQLKELAGNYTRVQDTNTYKLGTSLLAWISKMTNTLKANK